MDLLILTNTHTHLCLSRNSQAMGVFPISRNGKGISLHPMRPGRDFSLQYQSGQGFPFLILILKGISLLEYGTGNGTCLWENSGVGISHPESLLWESLPKFLGTGWESWDGTRHPSGSRFPCQRSVYDHKLRICGYESPYHILKLRSG
jgi:hypothetical protein